MTSTHEAVGDRLPDAGAGFFWETERTAARDLVWLRPETDKAVAAYTTRMGGVSNGLLRSLNLSWVAEQAEGDDHGHERVLANRAIAGRLVGAGPLWSTVKQVHGGEVVAATSPSSRRPADAQWTDDPQRTLAVLSADCVLLLILGSERIALVHAGWRGTIAGAIESSVEHVIDPEDAVQVFAGPAIGPCCFEVSPEVTDEFRMRYADAVIDDRHVDLWVAAELAARSAGAADFRAARLCTACHPELFYSHRRDGGRTGRHALVARLSADTSHG